MNKLGMNHASIEFTAYIPSYVPRSMIKRGLFIKTPKLRPSVGLMLSVGDTMNPRSKNTVSAPSVKEFTGSIGSKVEYKLDFQKFPKYLFLI